MVRTHNQKLNWRPSYFCFFYFLFCSIYFVSTLAQSQFRYSSLGTLHCEATGIDSFKSVTILWERSWTPQIQSSWTRKSLFWSAHLYMIIHSHSNDDIHHSMPKVAISWTRCLINGNHYNVQVLTPDPFVHFRTLTPENPAYSWWTRESWWSGDRNFSVIRTAMLLYLLLIFRQ